MLRLDPEARRRVDRAVRRGERVASAEEARLVVSMARASLRMVPMMVGLLLALIGLQVVWVMRRGPDLLTGLLFLVWALALGKFGLWDPPRLRQAERLNRDLLEKS